VSSNTVVWAALGVAIALDLVLSAVKAAFSHVRLPYLISLREKEPGEVDRTITLLEKVGLRTSSRLLSPFRC
jgi:hypothetical protein